MIRGAVPVATTGASDRHISSSTRAEANCPSSRGPPSVRSRVSPRSASTSGTRAASTPRPSPATTTSAPAACAAATRSAGASAPVSTTVGTSGEENSGSEKSR